MEERRAGWGSVWEASGRGAGLEGGSLEDGSLEEGGALEEAGALEGAGFAAVADFLPEACFFSEACVFSEASFLAEADFFPEAGFSSALPASPNFEPFPSYTRKRSSLKAAPRKRTRPSRSIWRLRPSKMSSSLAPTWFT